MSLQKVSAGSEPGADWEGDSRVNFVVRPTPLIVVDVYKVYDFFVMIFSFETIAGAPSE